MPITITPEQLDVKATSNGVDIPLTEEQKKKPLYYSFVSVNPSLTDYFPAEPWHSQIGADIPLASGRTRLRIEREGEERGLNADDGIIVDLHGFKSGLYGWDNIGKRYLNEEECDLYAENSGEELGMEERWAFYVVRIRLTDGPYQREMKFRTDEQKAELAKEGMFQSIGEAIASAFQQGSANMLQQGNRSASPEDMLKSVNMDTLMDELQRRQGAAVEEAPVDEIEAAEQELDATDFNDPEAAALLRDSYEEEVELDDALDQDEPEELIETTPGSSPIDEILARGTSA